MSTNKKVEVVEYNPEWTAFFEKEKAEICDALGDNCMEIHHIGSTSVFGLPAKPKIDIITSAFNRTKAIEALEKIGYSYDGEWNIPLQCGFTKRVGTCVNLHMFFEKNHPEIELNLAFRDYLRAHEDAKIAYGNLKKKILSVEENATKQVKVGTLLFSFYTLQKRAFIDNFLRKIGFNRLRVIKCLTDAEQRAAEKYREIYLEKLGKKSLSPIDFSDENFEHFILYKGVDICGYASLQIFHTPKITLIETQSSEQEAFFRDLINKWIAVHLNESPTSHN